MDMVSIICLTICIVSIVAGIGSWIERRDSNRRAEEAVRRTMRR